MAHVKLASQPNVEAETIKKESDEDDDDEDSVESDWRDPMNQFREWISPYQMITRFIEWQKQIKVQVCKEPWKWRELCNDGQIYNKKVQKTKPFLNLYKIMPQQGEIEKYMRLRKIAGFTGKNLHSAARGRIIEREAIEKARDNPGRHVTPKELNELAGFGDSDSLVSDESDSLYTCTERSNLETMRNKAKQEEKKELKSVRAAAAVATIAQKAAKEEEQKASDTANAESPPP